MTTAALTAKLQAFQKIIADAANNNNTPKASKPFLNSFKEFSGDLVEHLDKLESKISVSVNVSSLLEEKVATLENEVDSLEQYSRRNCLLIHGIKEEEKENVEAKVMDVVNTKLEVKLEHRDFDRMHRLGKKTPNSKTKPRPIIVKFSSYRERKKVFSVKKNLKNFKTPESNIVITENLTKKRYTLLNRCRDEFGSRFAWSFDGRIFAITDDENTKTSFSNEVELDNFLSH